MVELSERFGMRFAASFFLGSCNIRSALVCIDFINGIDNLQRLAKWLEENIGVVKVKKWWRLLVELVGEV